ncbi:MAG TPA: VOC family protein [Streptosporangiaceae bacterium]|jgi:catechol 2,3-dioxygenase-like lactoylglutathione lyase family enzyme
MFRPRAAFSGFSVDDLAAAREFYAGVLGLTTEDRPGGMRITLPGGSAAWAYPKEQHQPTSYTMLDFVVDDIDEAVAALAARGVRFERYEDGPPQDEKGILRGRSVRLGPDIAWFKDPAGNILAVLQEAD